MLVSLHIENFALIDRLDLQLQPGLNILTGETGAGKSIILDAIDAVLGGRATQRLVRAGGDRAVVEAAFLNTEPLKAWLTAQAIDGADQEHLICSRELTVTRNSVRSRYRLNGVQVNRPQLEELRQLLVEITAQGQTMQVGNADIQRAWLDGFGGPELLAQRERVVTAYAAALEALQTLDRRRQAEQQRLQQLDLFQYQAQELERANLGEPTELEDLEQERQRLSHSVELQQQSYQVYQVLYENDAGGSACADLLGKAEEILTSMLRYDPAVEPILEMVSNALAQVEEAGRQVNVYGETLETDPARLQDVQTRLSQLKQLCRKYDRTLPELIAYQQEMRATVEALNGDGQSVEALEQIYSERQRVLEEVCAHLTQLRQQAAKTLESQLISELKPLAMERVQFQVQIASCAPTAQGADQITFLFSPNPGEPLQPLAETASGGEMSRFLLALKACFSQLDAVNTMVFDEIDVGVSGRVVQAIAAKLHQLSRQHQVLCVTHQPIVAAMADVHFRVGKEIIEQANASPPKGRRGRKAIPASPVADGETEGVRTVVRVTQLSAEQRREELAQLAGGRSHQEAIAFADSLLAQADTIRKAS